MDLRIWAQCEGNYRGTPTSVEYMLYILRIQFEKPTKNLIEKPTHLPNTFISSKIPSTPHNRSR